jgi:hypothetical protein
MGWRGTDPFPEQVTLTVDDLVDDIVSMSPGFDDVHRPAVDIVDEWLGVR